MNRSKVGFIDNIESETISNENFRKVLFTAKHMQLVVMNLKPGEEIGMEVHENNDQFFRIEEGEAKVILNGEENLLVKDEVLIVPAGTNHNIINNSSENDCKIYTIYAPAVHPDGTIHKDKVAD